MRNITGDEAFNTIENAEYTACQEGGHRQEWNSLKRKSKRREEQQYIAEHRTIE